MKSYNNQERNLVIKIDILKELQLNSALAVQFVPVKFYSRYKIFQFECWHPSPALLCGVGHKSNLPSKPPSWFSRPFTHENESCVVHSHALYCSTADLTGLLYAPSVTDSYSGILFYFTRLRTARFIGVVWIDFLSFSDLGNWAPQSISLFIIILWN